MPVQLTTALDPVSSLQIVVNDSGGLGNDETVLANLSMLASALEEVSSPKKFQPFVEACSRGTNTKKMRDRRFVWFCRALGDRLLT